MATTKSMKAVEDAMRREAKEAKEEAVEAKKEAKKAKEEAEEAKEEAKKAKEETMRVVEEMKAMERAFQKAEEERGEQQGRSSQDHLSLRASALKRCRTNRPLSREEYEAMTDSDRDECWHDRYRGAVKAPQYR